MKRLLVTAFFILLTSVGSVLALDVPSKPIGRVSDYTGTLRSNEIRELDKALARFEQITTNQVAVVLIPTLAGDNLEDYSMRLADRWKIGQKGKDNGVIVLIVKNERKIRIEVGYGLEAVLPDAKAGDIIREDFAPRFRKGQFFDGIWDGMSAIMSAATKGEYRLGTRPVEREIKGKSDTRTVGRKGKKGSAPSKGFFSMEVIVMISIGVLFLIYWCVYNKASARELWYGSHTCGHGEGGGFWAGFWANGGGFGGGFSGGGGGFGGGGASGGW